MIIIIFVCLCERQSAATISQSSIIPLPKAHKITISYQYFWCLWIFWIFLDAIFVKGSQDNYLLSISLMSLNVFDVFDYFECFSRCNIWISLHFDYLDILGILKFLWTSWYFKYPTISLNIFAVKEFKFSPAASLCVVCIF